MKLTKNQKLYQEIVELHQNSKSNKEITILLEVSEATVERYLLKWRKSIPVEDIKSVGRPTKLTDSVSKGIISQLNKDKYSTSKDISYILNQKEEIDLSDRSVRRYLSTLSYKNSLPQSIPYISESQKEARVFWAQSKLDFNWGKVFFSDETTIQLNANKTRVWHKIGNRPNVPKKKFSLKVMFWGAISANMKSPLVVVTGTLKSQDYQKLLFDHFIPWFRKQKVGKLLFQQDNAPPHTSKSTKQFFEDNNIKVIPWPASSPDLNPIENVWGILKTRVNRRNPQTKDELIKITIEEWNAIEMNIVKRCIESMPKRINEVIIKNGNKIDY